MSPEISPLSRPRALRALVLSVLLPFFLLGGCATTSPRDPLEPMNRAIYSFNDGVDNVLFRPVAEGYRAVLPAFVRTGVSNVFANINDVLIALNNLLQGKFVNAISDVGRVVVNTTVGIAGFFDVATHFGLEKHNEDFGQTLGYWGVGDGPYLVLPIIGPSNLRDAVARVVDFKTDPITYVRSMSLRNSLWGTRALSQRAELLDTSKILETAALDPYEFLRDAYLQRRRSLIYDGAPPREKDDGAALDTTPRAVASTHEPPRSGGDSTLPSPSGRRAGDEGRDVMFTVAIRDARAEAQEPLAPASVAAPAAPLTQQQPTLAVTPDVTPKAATPATSASEPQAETELPSEPTAAGEPAQGLEHVGQRVLRVWVLAAD